CAFARAGSRLAGGQLSRSPRGGIPLPARRPYDGVMFSLHDFASLDAFSFGRGRGQRVDRHRLKLFWRAIYKGQQDRDAAPDALSAEERAALEGRLSPASLHLESRHDSERDGASKLVFRTGQGALIETVVLRVASGRVTLCLSSQAGCAARCAFCATGGLGL